ncbi:PITH domain-containing protein 1 [Scenedesmus sp. PABB004]|nr:PITH domain-containing protein 1 [Scenedesmus sp. PABB004]
MPPAGACCAHDHDCEAADCGPAYSLYRHIDLAHVRCLNEDVEGSCRHVFRAWAARVAPLEPPAVPLRSDPDDCELLLHIPFDGAAKLKAICIIGGAGGAAPSRMRAFINRDDLDFAAIASMQPTQEWDLQEVNANGTLEYPTQVARFNGVHSLDLHFPSTFGSEQSELLFVGLKGEFSERQRRAVEAVYEARPVPGDHKVPGDLAGPAWNVS